jgi:hypothetical protein
MARAWKIILIVVMALAILGVVLGAIGYFTGGSVDRMIEIVFGGRETLDLMLSVLRQQLAEIFKFAS